MMQTAAIWFMFACMFLAHLDLLRRMAIPRLEFGGPSTGAGETGAQWVQG